MNINSINGSYCQINTNLTEKVPHAEESESFDQILLEAVKMNDLERVEKLLTQFVYPSNNCLETCLFKSVEQNNLELLNILLKIDLDSYTKFLDKPFLQAIKQGSQKIVELFLDKFPNLRNLMQSPLLSAMDDKQYEIAKLLLNYGSHDINHLSLNGYTPFTLAIMSENEELVQLMIKHGADLTIICKGETVLHTISSIKNYNIAKAVMDNVDVQFFDLRDIYGLGRTPLERAGEYENKEFIQAMFSVRPDLVKKFINQPNEDKITRIQKLARDGSIETLNLLLPSLTDEEIVLNSEAHFTERDLQDCKAQPPVLENIPIDAIAFPLNVAQNFCNVMVKLNSGQILKIPNADAKQIYSFLMKKKFGEEAFGLENTNTLTLYVNPGHSFLRLNCESCDNGSPFDESQGFGPRGDDADIIEPKRFEDDSRFPLNSELYYASGGWLYETLYIPMAYLHQDLLSDRLGNSQSDKDYELKSNQFNRLKITFLIDDNQAKAALNKIKEVQAACLAETKSQANQSCIYNAAKHNCVEYVQDVFSTAGGSGFYGDYFTSEQLDYGALHLAAPSYAYWRSHGWKHYLDSFIIRNHPVNYIAQGCIGNSAYENGFSKFVTLKELEFSHVASSLAAGFLLVKGVSRAFSYLAEAWNYRGEECVTKTELDEWKIDKKLDLKIISNHLDTLGEQISKMQQKVEKELVESIGEVDRSVFQNEKAKWRELRQKQLGLLCDWMEIRQQMKNSKPTKSFIEKINEKVMNLAINHKMLQQEFEEMLQPTDFNF